jgi:hypothetical protein
MRKKRPFIDEVDDKLRRLYTRLVEDSRNFIEDLDKDLTFEAQHDPRVPLRMPLGAGKRI